MKAANKNPDASSSPPQIRKIDPILLVGKSCEMSLTDSNILRLWNAFMPHKNRIENQIPGLLYSVEIYPPDYFKTFNPNRPFVKWAAVAVNVESELPETMRYLTIPGGLYAVFRYKGLPEQASGFYRYIFSEWLPESDYDLDHRPHFSAMGKEYKNGDPLSEEDICIPIVPR